MKRSEITDERYLGVTDEERSIGTGSRRPGVKLAIHIQYNRKKKK